MAISCDHPYLVYMIFGFPSLHPFVLKKKKKKLPVKANNLSGFEHQTFTSFNFFSVIMTSASGRENGI